tara:strand:+ start:3719 stop:5053 length:1335 start_codon:yes stop_codon:yes gene_type:complete
MICRFAPSPSGFIHVGNARSAILNWAYAKKNNGKFILRIDDTDSQKSKQEFVIAIKENLKWLGLEWDKTFNQSSRLKSYEKNIELLKKKKRLYPCFETEEELLLKKKSLLSMGKPPIYDRSALNLTEEEINEKIKAGKKPHWRFKLEDGVICWDDLIKGNLSFDSKNLNDPILIREDGSLLYHLPSVIDDIDENVTDIIRGDDHISNTAYHIQIFQALDSTPPNFAHHPFLTDEKGKGFGKRIGSLSIKSLQDEGYENITILNYLLNIGSSKDINTFSTKSKLLEDFELTNISSSPPKFSKEILLTLNKDILLSYDNSEIINKVKLINNNLPSDKLWNFVKYNINFFHEIKYWIKIINSENNILSQNINENLVDIAIKTLPKEPYDENTWDDWTTAIKEISQFTGKDLYMPLRIALTGLNKGPELKYLIPLLNKSTILKKFGKI